MRQMGLTIIRERRARERAQDNTGIKPYNPSALYDPSTTTLNTNASTVNLKGNWPNEGNANTRFATRTPSPKTPTAPSGATMPAAPAPAQIQADVV